jgi:hypothetical protein
MRTIAHLGNLMVGWTSPAVLVAMADALHRLQPDVVAVSGNLTASGQSGELRAASTFLSTLPSPQVVVPGDLDRASTLSRVSRLLASSENFSTAVESNPTPCFADREIILVGVNSSNSSGAKPGAIDSGHRLRVENLLETADPTALRVLVSFRPVFLGDKFDPRPEDERVFRSVFDLALVGPLEPETQRVFRPSDTTLFVSSPARPEGLGFHLVRVQPPEVVLERYGWKAENGEFRLLGTETLRLAEARWTA